STLYFVHGGHFGQPLKMTSSTKSVVWDVNVEPFGQISQVVATIDQDLRLPGQWEQFETDLYQNWWRDYDPSIGRFVQPDPIGLAGGSNIYGYGRQNPLGIVDPDGRDVIVVNRP
ncbi:unnamed protein product, partial [Phaeothamnion confervicola]